MSSLAVPNGPSTATLKHKTVRQRYIFLHLNTHTNQRDPEDQFYNHSCYSRRQFGRVLEFLLVGEARFGQRRRPVAHDAHVHAEIVVIGRLQPTAAGARHAWCRYT